MTAESYAVGVSLNLTGNAVAAIDRLIAAMETLEKLSKSLAGVLDGAVLGSMKAATAVARDMGAALKQNAELAERVASAMSKVRPPGGGAPGPGPRANGGGIDTLLLGVGLSQVGESMTRSYANATGKGFSVEHLRQMLLADRRVAPGQADAAVKAAFAATDTAPGTRVSENLAAVLDLKSITGDLNEAQTLLPAFARLSAVLRAIDEQGGGKGDAAFAAAKALEIMGGQIDEVTDATGHTTREINPAKIAAKVEAMARVAVATNARVMPQDYLGFAKQARVAGMQLSDEFIYEKLPAIMMVLGGTRTGTALMSMAQLFDGDKLTKGSKAALSEIGLFRNGQVTDADLLRHDPEEWMKKAQGRMEAKGVHGTEAQITALLKASQRATVAGMLADILKDMPNIEKEQANIRNITPGFVANIMNADPTARMQQFGAAVDKVMTAFGSAAAADAVLVLGKLTGALSGLGDWAQRNANLARILTEVTGALGGIALVAGKIALATALFKPLLGAIGLGGETTATAGAATAAAGAVSTVSTAARFGALAPLAAALIGAVHAGSDPSWATPDAERARLLQAGRDAARRPIGFGVPQDGFDEFGNPIPTGPAGPRRTGSVQDPLHVIIANPRDVGDAAARGTMRGLTNTLSGPPVGPTSPDIRVNPYVQAPGP